MHANKNPASTIIDSMCARIKQTVKQIQAEVIIVIFCITLRFYSNNVIFEFTCHRQSADKCHPFLQI